ncbi:MAG TPA: hypothetical protein VF733_01435 [Candidatus Saccharimonadales bacterium]
MPGHEFLFPGANIYPHDAESLAKKLPLVCSTARSLMRPLLERALTTRGAKMSVKNAGQNEYATEVPAIRECIKKRDEENARTYEEFRFPLDGAFFLAELGGCKGSANYEMGTRFLRPSAAGLENAVLRPEHSKSTIMITAMEGDHLPLLVAIRGAVESVNNGSYWISHNMNGNPSHEALGPPVLGPDITARQSVMYERHGLYGLAYDELLGHLSMMHNIASGRVII